MLGLGCLQRGQDGEGIAAGSEGRARRVSRRGTPSQAETGTAEGGEKKRENQGGKENPAGQRAKHSTGAAASAAHAEQTPQL